MRTTARRLILLLVASTTALMFLISCTTRPDSAGPRGTRAAPATAQAGSPLLSRTAIATVMPLPPPGVVITGSEEMAAEAGESGSAQENGPEAESVPAASPAPAFTAAASPSVSLSLSAAQPGTSEGFELVGQQSLGGIGWHAGLALQDDCAYVGNRQSGEVAIVNIADPARPTVIGRIPFGASGRPVELRTLPEWDLLVVADFEAARLLTFDVADCAQPRQLGVIELPGAPHEFYLWSDGERALVYGAMFDHAANDLIVIDVTDPAAPQELLRWSAEQAGVEGLLHSITVSPSGDRAYLALWTGVVVAELALPEVRVLRDGTGAAQPASFVAAHSAVPLQNADAPGYLLVTSELWSCPFGNVAILNVANPARPHIVATVALPENRCEELPAADAVFTPHNPLVVGDLVFLSWYGAGVQVLDVSDPEAPARVAQFVPEGEGAAATSYIGSYPVQTWSYPILRDGLLYVVDIQSGLYVLRYTGPGAAEIALVPHAEGNVTVRK